MSDEARAAPPSDPSNGQLDRDGPVADVWDAASLRMSAENCRIRAESLKQLTGAGEDYIWRPADGARGTLLNVAAILDSIAAARATPPADSPGGDRMVAESSQAAYAQRLCDAVRKQDHSAVCGAGIRCICGYDDRVLELADAADFVLSSPPPAVERREQIAREELDRLEREEAFKTDYQRSKITVETLRRLIAAARLALPPQAAPGVVDQQEYEFEVHQGGGFAASACSESRAKAAQEALHYAAVYGQDGPVTLFELTRTPITIEALAALSASRS